MRGLFKTMLPRPVLGYDKKKALRLARACREQANSDRTKFYGTNRCFTSGRAPHCPLGHVIERAGLTSDVYEYSMSAESYFVTITDQSVGPLTHANDSTGGEPDATRQELRNLANRIEEGIRQRECEKRDSQ